MSGPKIELDIDELILHGFAASDRFRIAEAFRSELTRLLTEHSRHETLPRSLNIDRIQAASFKVTNGAKPAAIGAQVAQSVYRQVGPAVLGPRIQRTVKK
jgi:hypothetical protein